MEVNLTKLHKLVEEYNGATSWTVKTADLTSSHMTNVNAIGVVTSTAAICSEEVIIILLQVRLPLQ